MSDTNTPQLDVDDLRRLVAYVLDVDPAEVTDEARFVEDLGGDSLQAVEVLVELEKQYGVTFTKADVAALTSLPKVCELITAKRGGRA